MTSAALADDSSPRTHLQWRPYRPEHVAQRANFDSSIQLASDEEPINDASAAPRITAQRLQSDMDIAQAAPNKNPALFDPFGDKTKANNAEAPATTDTTPATPKTTNPGKGNPFTDDNGAPALPVTPAQPAAPAQPVLTQPVAPPATLPPATTPDAQPAPMRTTPLPDDNLRFRSSPVPPSNITPSPNTSTEDAGCAQYGQSCEKELSDLYKHTIDKVNIDITEAGKPGEAFPCECGLGDVKYVPRQWDCITYTWKASALCHKPLYFEETSLERYGHSRGPILDPLVSTAHFFVTVPLLPYYMGVYPPDECQYALGYYRPGSCAPWIIDGFPLSIRGACYEATAVVGTAYLFP